LVARDDGGKPHTVRYETVNAMLLNEFLKEHCKVEAQDCMLQEQQKQIEALTAMVKQQAARIQKVSDRLAMSETKARWVDNYASPAIRAAEFEFLGDPALSYRR
jgi:cytoplasmic iron level regulating protein YaaA (DUF328/UPF0246 family)